MDAHEALIEKVGLALANLDRLNAGLNQVRELSAIEGADHYRNRSGLALSVVAEALREPTEEMVSAAMYRLDSPFYSDIEVGYEAMLSVSPLYPKKDGGNGERPILTP